MNRQINIPGLCVLLFGIVFGAFLLTVNCGFQFYDEADDLIKNPHVNSGLSPANFIWAFSSFEKSNWYPLTWISQMIDFDLFEQEAGAHHFTNIIFHAGNAVLLFLVLHRMTGAAWRSFVAAGLFALHPLRVESVAWISERKDVLSVFFGLLALWNYVRFVEESKTGGRTKFYYGLSLAFFACSLMSKAMLVTFPFVLLLLDYWPLRRDKKTSVLAVEKIPFFLLILPISIVAYLAEKSGGSLNLVSVPMDLRIENAIISYARYLGKMFWPTNYSVYYPYPNSWPAIDVALALLLLVAVSIFGFARRQGQPYLIVGWLWFLGTLVPVIGFVQEGAQSMANRYTYFPAIGLTVALVWFAADLIKVRRAVAVFAASLMIFCSYRTVAEIGYWKDSATLWSRAVAVTENNWMAHECLGIVLAQNNPAAAVEQFRQSVALNPGRFESQLDLAGVLIQLGQLDEAIEHFQDAAKIQPQNSWLYNGIAMCRIQQGRKDDAIAALQKAIELDPKNGAYKLTLEELTKTNSN